MAADGAGDGVSPDAIVAMIKALLPIAIFLAVGFLAGTSVITAPSVSLEGKKISVLQAFPIHMKQVLWSKIEFHCLIALPFVIPSVIMAGIGLGLGVLDVIIVVILSAIMIFFFGVFGLACNLKYPMLNWTNENVALKQSMSVIFCMLVGVLAPLVFALLYFFVFINFLMPSIYLLIIAVLFGLVSWMILRWLNTKGAKKFQYLS
jgi:ABC-2 type transport system permease protein